ncbi:unnamed protein product [Dimorphilus gyrociliatus]|uniref:Uncharacterized protein n=1 Tax=Dimorphilus gyrociliatus TaxID=2664684 RepID=A0A7I8VKS3_9ANNE|nr:unnamed protein product [Dimorphilus gyrociliatus]
MNQTAKEGLKFRPKSVKINGKKDKLPVAKPTHIGNFLVMLILYACRKVLFYNTTTKIGLYLCGVTVLSLVTDIVPIPRSYFSNKKNFFNQYFAKLGWFWTFSIAGMFIISTSYVYTLANRRRITSNLLRLLVATGLWYVSTTAFNFIERITGFCSNNPSITWKRECVRNGGTWVGFDISGHCFLLTYAILILHEEAKVLRGWERIPDQIEKEVREGTCRIPESDRNSFKLLYDRITPTIRVCFVLMASLAILWEVMLFITVLYFHNMPQKLTGTCVACMCWLITYSGYYHHDNSPGMPGKDSVVKALKKSS